MGKSAPPSLSLTGTRDSDMRLGCATCRSECDNRLSQHVFRPFARVLPRVLRPYPPPTSDFVVVGRETFEFSKERFQRRVRFYMCVVLCLGCRRVVACMRRPRVTAAKDTKSGVPYSRQTHVLASGPRDGTSNKTLPRSSGVAS